MKTAFIGAGPGCMAVLDLFEQGRLSVLDLEMLAVVDVDPDAPGLAYARSRGWPTLGTLDAALALPGLELVIELTGSDAVLDAIHSRVPSGIRVMDHRMARVFWDLGEATSDLRQQLHEKTILEARAEDQRAQLQEILDTIPDVVMVVDPLGRIQRVNKRFEHITGRSRTDPTGIPCSTVFSGPCADSANGFTEPSCGIDFTRVFDATRETRRPHTLLQQCDDPARGERWFQMTAHPLADELGELIRVVLTARDISEQVRLERETQELARRFRQITSAVHGIITIKGLDGRYQLFNPRACQFFGIAGDLLTGRTAVEFLPPETAAVIERNDAAALREGGRHVAEEVIKLGDEEHVLVSERLPLTDYRDELVAICCIARDVTQERQLQRELMQTERLAAVGKLAAGVAHELNNPLTGILTFAEDLALEADPDDPIREDLETILHETLRCRRIVKDLLDFSRHKAPERVRVRTSDVVQRIVGMVRRQASFHNVVFTLELDANLPLVDADPTQLQQAILNLVVNARDALRTAGEIRLRTSAGDGGRTVVVSVRDTGCGIPAEALERIWEPFFSTKGDQGNGLGLSVVRTVAEQHGGRVEVDSVVGEGTSFRLVLPIPGG